MNKAINCIWPRAPWEMPQTNKAGAADRSSDLPYHILATCPFLSALHQALMCTVHQALSHTYKFYWQNPVNNPLTQKRKKTVGPFSDEETEVYNC